MFFYLQHFSSDLGFKGIVVNRQIVIFDWRVFLDKKNKDGNYFQEKMRKVVLLLCVLLPILVISNPRNRRQVKWLKKKRKNTFVLLKHQYYFVLSNSNVLCDTGVTTKDKTAETTVRIFLISISLFVTWNLFSNTF